MKVPRDVGGDDLVKALRRLGYSVTRQTGSHVRLTITIGGETRQVSVPMHAFLKIGTIHGILTEVAEHLGTDTNSVTQRLFG
ncbi:MAG: type II toxin-antitoxin system HicA family toxin [Chloroflexi bacterium]|nr:type II toxin-antitoxin system HicA family toxin [Chloroflexota bacterium]